MRLDSQSALGMNGRIMETLKPFMLGFAVIWPAVVCIILAWRVVFHCATDWKLACCLSGLSVATSLVLLLASEKLLFLRYQEAVLQVNQKADEVAKLTEQNKRIATAAARGIASAYNAAIIASGGSLDVNALEEMLKAAGLSRTEIDGVLRPSQPARKT